MSTSPLQTSLVLEQIRDGEVPWAVETEHFAISEPIVKSHPATTLLVRSSGDPISLGAPMSPFTNTRPLRQFMKEHGIVRLPDTPEDVWLFHWVARAQGPMVFEVGWVVSPDTVCPENDQGIRLRHLEPTKFSSIIYRGPFPKQPNTGWPQIQWAERAAAKGFVYTEKLYRELYHVYDQDPLNAHITEIEISIA